MFFYLFYPLDFVIVLDWAFNIQLFGCFHCDLKYPLHEMAQ